MTTEEIRNTDWSKRKTDKLAIVGTADSKHLAPLGNPEFELWGVNNLYAVGDKFRNFTRWFEIHDISFDGRTYYRRGKPEFRGKRVNDYLAELQGLGIPVYMQKACWPIIPNAIEYPVREILNRFGNYFTNSVSWQIALGIHLGFKEIHVYGVDMAVDTEYYHQRPSCEYFLGLATGLGIKVYIPPEADLLKCRYLYAFDEKKADAFELKCNNLIQSMAQRQSQSAQIASIEQKKVEQFTGAMQAVKEVMKIWSECNNAKE